MTQAKLKGLVASLMGTLLLAACGGGGHDTPSAAAAPAPVTPVPEVTVAVPAEVATSATAATTYVASLSSQPAATTDSLEPVAVPEQVAQDDTAEPQ